MDDASPASLEPNGDEVEAASRAVCEGRSDSWAIPDDRINAEIDARTALEAAFSCPSGTLSELREERDAAVAEVGRMRGLCHHHSQTIEPEGKLRCELCGAVEQDPFWRNPA